MSGQMFQTLWPVTVTLPGANTAIRLVRGSRSLRDQSVMADRFDMRRFALFTKNTENGLRQERSNTDTC